jgi:PRD1 phage membrane DNA delivery
MLDEFIDMAVGIFVGVVSLATLSVIVSKKSSTPQVIQATGTALSKIVAAAVNPVNTANTNSNLSVLNFSGIGASPLTPAQKGTNG